MIELTFALILFLFPLAYSPGPGNLFFAANGARFGFASTLNANLGYHIATWLITAAIGFGFSVLVNLSEQLFIWIKLVGSVYVIILGIKFFKIGMLEDRPDAKPAGFIDGVAILILNPKAYAIIALMFTQFLGRFEMGQTRAVIWITTIFTLNNMIAFAIWSMAGDKIAAKFRDRTNAGRLNLFFGILLMLVGIWMLLA